MPSTTVSVTFMVAPSSLSPSQILAQLSDSNLAPVAQQSACKGMYSPMSLHDAKILAQYFAATCGGTWHVYTLSGYTNFYGIFTTQLVAGYPGTDWILVS